MRSKILIVAGARPNFIKITQFGKELGKYPDQFEYRIFHTGQHYDVNMSDVFFEQFELKKPDYFLEIKEQTPTQQIGRIMTGLEEILIKYRPDLVMVVGDINSTMAASITANRLGIKIAHLESGLRSFDRSMPEEINRIITDIIADIYFVTEEAGKVNLIREGRSTEQIFFVGNTMIDTLVAFEGQINASRILTELNINNDPYILMTIHRPSNVDSKDSLTKVLDLIDSVSTDQRVVFPVHPRTLGRFTEFGLQSRVEHNKNLVTSAPLAYFDFQKLISSCQLVITDSGGIQEETTFRQIPCLTLRENTERPSTTEIGTNTLISFDLQIVKEKIREIKSGEYKKGAIPELWDGKATERIVKILSEIS